MVSEPSIRGSSSAEMMWGRIGGGSWDRRADASSGGVGGGATRHVLGEMPSHQKAATGGILHITVSHVLYPVTKEVLHQVLEAYGVEKMSMLERVNQVEAMVQLRSWQGAEQARDALHGRCIYDRCCFLDILLVQPTPDSASTTTARRGAEASTLATEVVVDARSSPSDMHPADADEPMSEPVPSPSPDWDWEAMSDEQKDRCLRMVIELNEILRTRLGQSTPSPTLCDAQATPTVPGLKVDVLEGFKVTTGVPDAKGMQHEACCLKCSLHCIFGHPSPFVKVTLLSRIRHRNLVTFLGYSRQDGKNILVYELHNGTLKEHLRGGPRDDKITSWVKRPEIAEDAAKGIEYLHTGCSPTIIHRDLKRMLHEEAKPIAFYMTRKLPHSCFQCTPCLFVQCNNQEVFEQLVFEFLVPDKMKPHPGGGYHKLEVFGIGAEPTSPLLKILSVHALKRPWDPGGQDIAIASLYGIKTKENAGTGVQVISSECSDSGLINCTNDSLETANEGNRTITNLLLACTNGSRNEVARPCSELAPLAVGHQAQREDSFDEYQDTSPFLHQLDSEDSAAVAHNSQFYTEIKNLNTVSLQQRVAANEILVETNVLCKDHSSREPCMSGFSADSKVGKEVECYSENRSPGLAEPKVSLKLEIPEECSVNIESNNTDMVDSKYDKTSSYCELIGDLNALSIICQQLQSLNLLNNRIIAANITQSYNRTLVLVGNPVCLDSEFSNRFFCSLQQEHMVAYTTSVTQCGPTSCSSDQSLDHATCSCAYPYKGKMVFRAPLFADLSNSANFQQLEKGLWTELALRPGAVFLSDVHFDSDGYLQVQGRWLWI